MSEQSAENDADIYAIARAMCDSEAFMWLMVGANHPDAHLRHLRETWQGHYLPAGGGYDARARGAHSGVIPPVKTD